MLYLHIPYCHQRCSYCAFYSSATRHGQERYVEALCKEIADRAPLNADGSVHQLQTLYLGGGTPTHLAIPLLRQVTDAIRHHYDLTQLKEATIEANPEDLTPDYLAQLRELALFNRISIGLQSMDNDELRLLNRRCSSQQNTDAIQEAHRAGFRNISVDLIYGLPGSSRATWEQTLAKLEPHLSHVSHLSAYALSVEPGTMLARQIAQGHVTPADEESTLEQYDILQRWCRLHNLRQYEISSYCRPGHASLHNSRYWDRTPYVGVGAAAHSFDGTHRRWNVADIQQYTTHVLEGGPYAEVEELTLKDAHNEYLMTALRTTDGIVKARLLPPFSATLRQKIAPYLAAGLLTETPTAYQPTPRGLLQADGIAADLFELNEDNQ